MATAQTQSATAFAEQYKGTRLLIVSPMAMPQEKVAARFVADPSLSSAVFTPVTRVLSPRAVYLETLPRYFKRKQEEYGIISVLGIGQSDGFYGGDGVILEVEDNIRADQISLLLKLENQYIEDGCPAMAMEFVVQDFDKGERYVGGVKHDTSKYALWSSATGRQKTFTLDVTD